MSIIKGSLLSLVSKMMKPKAWFPHLKCQQNCRQLQPLRVYSLSRASFSSELYDYVEGVRAGELTGVSNHILDGCKVCNSLVGIDPVAPLWMRQWIRYHDGYDEVNGGSGAVLGGEGNCPLIAGHRCGKYCCNDVANTEDIQ